MPCSWLYTSFILLYTDPTLTTLSYTRHCSSIVPESNMFLISNVLSCIVVGRQILRVRRYPELLPHISLVMLAILSLGHMVTLALNVESVFTGIRIDKVHVNAVAVGLTAVAAFLLHISLARLVWAAKRSGDQEESLRSGEKRSVLVSLALYGFGGLLTLLWTLTWNGRYWRYSIWGDLRSYAGLILDGFLFPQILLTVFSNSIEKALTRWFYFGTSVVRLLPHAYNQYRTSAYLTEDYVYSMAWDLIVVPSGVLALAMIVDQI